MKEFTLTKPLINKLSDECFGITPSQEQIKEIANDYDDIIDKYGEIYMGDVIDIIAEVVLNS